MAVVIAAVPEPNDYTWKTSSEKIPHMTLLYLGDISNLAQVTDYVSHVVSTSLYKFVLDVDHRGVLGDQSADVLFFQDRGLEKIKDFQSYLLGNKDIRNAYNSIEQHPEWTPHLTLGYPDTPAKKTDGEIHSVVFDRIALWTGDFEGVEFPLKTNPTNSLYMSDVCENLLQHHGIKGMHWGVRKDRPLGKSPAEVLVKSRPGKAIRVSGGRHHGPHMDAVQVAISRQKARKSSTDSLSTKELQQLVTRMNLEQQYSQLVAKNPNTKSDVQKILSNAKVVGKSVNDIHTFLNSPAGKLAKAALKAKLGK